MPTIVDACGLPSIRHFWWFAARLNGRLPAVAVVGAVAEDVEVAVAVEAAVTRAMADAVSLPEAGATMRGGWTRPSPSFPWTSPPPSRRRIISRR